MKKPIAVVLLFVLVLSTLLPTAVHAANVQASLVKTSGAVYPGSSLTVAIVASGSNIEMMQGKKIEYNAEQLTMSSQPSSGIDGWSYSEGGLNFIIDKALSASAVSGNDLTLLRFSFKLKDGVKIGDTISIKIKGVIISTTNGDGFSGDLSFSVKVAEKPKNTNTNLMVLQCSDGTLTPSFDPATLEYSVKVSHIVDALTLNVVQAGEGAKYEIKGNENLKYGENTVSIVVTAENGDTKTYVIKVDRDNPPSTEAKLAALEIAGFELSPAFKSDVYSYTLNVSSDTSTLKITAEPAESHARISVKGNSDFKEGENTVTIAIVAENGEDHCEYVLHVMRARAIETDAALASLSFGEYALSPAFDGEANDQNYVVNVPNEITDCSLLAAALRGKYATMEIAAPDALYVGDNRITVKVTSESGVTKNYFINVIRGKNEDATLKSLVASKGQLDPEFSPDVFCYSLITNANPGQITITSEPNNPNAFSEQLSFIPQEGVTRQTLRCTAQSGKELVYTVFIVTKPAYMIIEGAGAIGQTLTTRVSGYPDGGVYAWYANGEKIEGATDSTYTIVDKDEGKIIYATYEAEGSTIKSQFLTISAKVNVDPGGQITIETEATSRTTDLVIVIILAVVCIIIGCAIGVFFTKRKYKNQQ